MGEARAAAVRRLAVVLVSALAAASCTPLVQYRTETLERSPSTGELTDRICEIDADGTGPADCAVEHRRYRYPAPDGTLETWDYYLAFIELDDRGWFWDRTQLETLMRLLFSKQDEDLLIFAHAHGWQHNADPCDNNVVCFQRFLERTDLSERGVAARRQQADIEARPRKIVGVYIGWRGKSGRVKRLNATTFWARKNAGTRVGVGGVSELLTRLNDLRGYRNPTRAPDKTQLIISGHSFGGQVVYKALAHGLIERAVHMGPEDAACREVEGAPYGHCVARSFGDLVVLVNPAFEGAAYESLHHAATNRCYPGIQRPAMLTITSRADKATGIAFPLGRSLSTFLGKTRRDVRQKATVLKTVGHLDRYRTHRLQVPAGEPSGSPPTFDDGECGCPYLEPTETYVPPDEERELMETMEQARGMAGDEKERQAARAALHLEADYTHVRYGSDIELVREPDYAANYPYLVIETTADFIPSHSQIFGERFTDFLRRFYYRHLVEQLEFPKQCFTEVDPTCLPTEITPCGRSWTGRLRSAVP